MQGYRPLTGAGFTQCKVSQKHQQGDDAKAYVYKIPNDSCVCQRMAADVYVKS